jgi:photosynthetic reaction center H subunit
MTMSYAAFTQYIDLAQVTLYLFWIFFAGLIYYLHRENKREGYPLQSDRSGVVTVQGWPAVPQPKTYRTAFEGSVAAPRADPAPPPLAAEPVGDWPGAPLQPTGDPMLDGIGPGAYALRQDKPDLTVDGRPRIVPLRVDGEHSVSPHDPDPRGKPVIGADGEVGGTVVDLWVDRSEAIFRYLEVEVAGSKRHVLLPVNFSRIGRSRIDVRSILGAQFADVPGTAGTGQVTRLEEDRICAYYGAGTLYATPGRQEPLL